MKTNKYKFGDQSNCIRLGNLLDDMWQVHAYFHKWQRQRYKDGLPYANHILSINTVSFTEISVVSRLNVITAVIIGCI